MPFVYPDDYDADDGDAPLARRPKVTATQRTLGVKPRGKKKLLTTITNTPTSPSDTSENTGSTSATTAMKQLQIQRSLPSTLASSSASALKAKSHGALFSQENQENMKILSRSDSGTTANPKSDATKSSSKKSQNMSAEQSKTALEELQIKYNNLKQLRMTDAERNLEECRIKLEEATRSAENYRAQIEPQLDSALRYQEKMRDHAEETNAKLRTLQRQVRDHEQKARIRDQEDKKRAKEESMASALASPDVSPTSAITLATMRMYENLTGLKIFPQSGLSSSSSRSSRTSNQDETSNIWECEHSGPRGNLRFSLNYDKKTDMVTYSPAIDKEKEKELVQALPDYLMDDIEFERQFENKFFWRILNFNNEES
ncbi:hypothetical protein BGW38_003411 [Lunasporangiospora selenospora]|uniref:Monopolin complex subunit Csm1/Pcs1 C-terminal domain-containing protein n=1 Tax=Lunasporangiospora selenospora TaxID=979761 RepID=A0A9P6KCV2_9FUNG|nr:hypothetical protein BGW38_003411 [Lunasporangiospora selenospora]